MKKKLLLDENLLNPLKAVFDETKFEVTSVHDMGWATSKNGNLLAAMAEAGLEYLLTADKSLPFLQNLDKYPARLVLIRTHDNRFKVLSNDSKIKYSILFWGFGGGTPTRASLSPQRRLRRRCGEEGFSWGVPPQTPI